MSLLVIIFFIKIVSSVCFNTTIKIIISVTFGVTQDLFLLICKTKVLQWELCYESFVCDVTRLLIGQNKSRAEGRRRPATFARAARAPSIKIAEAQLPFSYEVDRVQWVLVVCQIRWQLHLQITFILRCIKAGGCLAVKLKAHFENCQW